MLTLKQFCEAYNVEPDRAFSLVLGEGGGILPQKMGFQGYFAEITDTGLVCINDKLGVKTEIPFASFQRAEFGIGSGNLWLQCIVDGSPFIFCTTRKAWKAPSAKLLIQKIEEQVGIIDMREYEKYTGKLFFIYMFK